MSKVNESARWKDLDRLLLKTGPFAPSEFDPSEDLKQSFFEYAKILVVGAGGLGCEILKDLALMGFKDIHVIDLDTIDVTNLNRQFLFRQADVGKHKAQVAADFIQKRVPGCKVTAHVGKIQEKPKEFYESFQVIIAGLDNVEARRWLNQLVHSLVEWDGEQVKPETCRPLIDGGTEGFKGQARVIMPFKAACFECTLDTLPRGNTYNFCTVAKTPRIPEHCIAYVQMILWDEHFPDRKIDTDSVEDMTWIYERAKERADEFGIKGVTFKLTQGVIKNIIPAIASTNALISAACANEAFKIMTGCSKNVDNYMMFMGQDGIYTNVIKYESKHDCPVCIGMRPKRIKQSKNTKLKDFLDVIAKDEKLNIENPSVSSPVAGVLYLSNPTFAHLYAENLEKSLEQLRQSDGVPVLELNCQGTNKSYADRFIIDFD